MIIPQKVERKGQRQRKKDLKNEKAEKVKKKRQIRLIEPN
jgi:hypothetical protein